MNLKFFSEKIIQDFHLLWQVVLLNVVSGYFDSFYEEVSWKIDLELLINYFESTFNGRHLSIQFIRKKTKNFALHNITRQLSFGN